MEINMKPGYIVENQIFGGICDCITVCNYGIINEVVNRHSLVNILYEVKGDSMIGVWKLKKLK